MFSKISHAYINANTYAGEFFQNNGVYLYICISVSAKIRNI